MSRRVLLRAPAVLAAALVLGATFDAMALPPLGSAPGKVTVEDTDGKRVPLASFAGKPILILYEDKDSADQNKPLKDELSKKANGDRYRSRVALVPIADVSGYDYWPVRGFVERSIESESKKVGTPIFCDFTGSTRRALHLKAGTSNVVLVGRGGGVVFAGEGALDAAARSRLFALLAAEVAG